MKSEHRHELKTNELAEWIENFPQWAQKNLKVIIYVSVVAILVIGTFFWKRYEKNVLAVQKQAELTLLLSQLSQTRGKILEAHVQGIDLSYMLMQPADKLKDSAQNTKNGQMAAVALTKRADTLRAELHYRLGGVNKRDLETQMGIAKADYNKAIKKAGGNPGLTSAATFGLGLCEEDLGNFEKATQIYNEIVKNPDFEGTVSVVKAQLRIDTMVDSQKPVYFKPAPKKTSVQPLQPQIKLNIPDVNIPSQ